MPVGEDARVAKADQDKREEVRQSLGMADIKVDDLRALVHDQLSQKAEEDLLDDAAVELIRRDYDEIIDNDGGPDTKPDQKLAIAPAVGVGAYEAGLLLLGILGVGAAAGVADRLNKDRPGTANEARRHRDKKRGPATPTNEDAKRSGKKARDAGKNEGHGDDGREMEKAEKHIEKLEEGIDKLPKKQREKIRSKIGRIRRAAQKAAKGTNHSTRGKGER